MASTIRDVAKHAGVGVGTVSRVLNDSQSVSKATRSKVLDAIAALDYVPNTFARRLSLGKTLTVGVVAPFFTRPSVVERLRGVEKVLAETKYDLKMFNVETAGRFDRTMQAIARPAQLDGLLIISISPKEPYASRLLEAQLPTVLIDSEHDTFSHLLIDDVDGGYVATQHLLSLGHRRIGFVGDTLKNPFGFTAIQRRFDGYRQALAEADVPFCAAYHGEGKHGRLPAVEMAAAMLELDEPPTAIFAASDTQAVGVLEAAHMMELSVPEELSIIGYDDIEIADHLQLTTIRQPLMASGTQGAELLLEEMTAEGPTGTTVCLPTQLIVRQTTAALTAVSGRATKEARDV